MPESQQKYSVIEQEALGVVWGLNALAGEISPFLCSGSHQVQRDCQLSALNCFVEAMSQCVPPIPIRPCVLKYLGKTHNLWFRSTLMLEHQAFEKGLSLQIKSKQTSEFYEQESITPPQQDLDCCLQQDTTQQDLSSGSA
ncbi:UNVERIFIED_CONTAM: hypothetical protein K2H54_059647 [Gekko kuhli]